jgi:hypothetical protein
MKQVQISKGKNHDFSWQFEETWQEDVAGFVNALWNWGIPVFCGVMIGVTLNIWWMVLAIFVGDYPCGSHTRKKAKVTQAPLLRICPECERA